ncbi:hypothetical protein B0J14DRAFT_607414 [Halenospora varia]|nr:hypothetical protein B0J14DRAFT_607414 [Halenospora varia]
MFECSPFGFCLGFLTSACTTLALSNLSLERSTLLGDIRLWLTLTRTQASYTVLGSGLGRFTPPAISTCAALSWAVWFPIASKGKFLRGYPPALIFPCKLC